MEVEALNVELAPFRILTGMEVDILEDGGLDLDDDLLARLDVVVASVHSKLRMERKAMTERMVLAVASPHVDILGHCTGRLIGKRPPSTFDADYVFAACAQFGTAVEINSRPERLDPPRELLDMAVAYGCWFSIDSDAHATGQLEWQPHGCNRGRGVRRADRARRQHVGGRRAAGLDRIALSPRCCGSAGPGSRATVGPGHSFGEMALIDGHSRSADVVASTDVELYPVNRSLFLVLVQDTPYFALEVMKSLTERLRRAGTR